MGANTSREVAGMGGVGSAVQTHVVTHDPGMATRGKTRLCSGDLRELVAEIKSSIPEDKDICVCGGAQI